MTDWIHQMACDWGHWMRKSDAMNGSIQGTLGRIREEGLDGAAIREHGGKIPIIEWPLDIGRFHRAWLGLEPHLQGVIFVDYRIRDSLEKKLSIMRMKKSKYYRVRRQALDTIARLMATLR